jgi:PAS domain-containing protein
MVRRRFWGVLRPAEEAALVKAFGAVVAIGDDGLVAYANARALRLLHWSRHLVGQRLSVLVPDRLKERQHRSFQGFVLARGRPFPYPKVLPAVGEDGQERPVLVQVLAFRRPDGSLFMCSSMAPEGEPAPPLASVHDELAANGYRLLAGDPAAVEPRAG